MLHNHIARSFTLVAAAALLLSLSACDEHEHTDLNHAHLDWIDAPAATMAVGTAGDIAWMIHTEGELHHTEIRACMGQNAECGLGGVESYDENFQATMEGDTYNASVTLETAGTWSLAAFAHVGEEPNISEVVYVTVE